MFRTASIALLILAAGTALAGPPQKISECNTTITDPGKYKVVRDLACPDGEMGIKILASDVKLDLHGHTISCETPVRSGVIVGDRDAPEVFSNVRISNGAVTGCAIGVLLNFTDGARVTKIELSSNAESAITLVAAQNNVIRKNLIEGAYEGIWGIASWGGTGNWYGHNTFRHAYVGIDLYAETDSRITCNTAYENFYTFSLGPFGPAPSSGNLIRGNLFTSNFYGMIVAGIGEPPDTLLEPMSTDNLIHSNIVLGGWLDVTESIYSYTEDEFFLLPESECQNMWKNNMFESHYGPENCIGEPVVLDDVCASEDDD